MAINTLFENIADAIRERGGTLAALTPAQMPAAIAAIPAGGSGTDPSLIDFSSRPTRTAGTDTFTISEDGTYTIIIVWTPTQETNVQNICKLYKNNIEIPLTFIIGTGSNYLCYSITNINANAGDVLLIQTTSYIYNAGLQTIILKGAETLTYDLVMFQSNSSTLYPYVSTTANYLLFVSQFGYNGGQNTIPHLLFTKNLGTGDGKVTCFQTPNQQAYYYGGSYILGFWEGNS